MIGDNDTVVCCCCCGGGGGGGGGPMMGCGVVVVVMHNPSVPSKHHTTTTTTTTTTIKQVTKQLDHIRRNRNKFVCLNDNMNETNANINVIQALHDLYNVRCGGGGGV